MNKKLNRQIDLQVSGLHVREAGEGEKSRTIEGYAVVFGVRSVNLTPWSEECEVYEIMEPGCITPDLLSRSDVVLTAFHKNDCILGRWRMGKGTLSLELDQRGMKVRCTLAETAVAEEMLSAVDRGDISGMSFAFTADEEDSVNGVAYEKTDERTASGKVVWLRHVKKVTGLYDVTIAGHPAYEQTTIEAREIADMLDEKLRACGGEDEEAKRKAEEDAKAKAEEEAKKKAEEEKKAKREQEERELEEQAQRFRKCQMLRLRMKARILNDETFEQLNY